MKKFFIAAAFVALAVSCDATQGEKSTAVAAATEATSVSNDSSLAYVNMDLIISQSDMFEQEGLPLQKRSETAQRDWSQKEQSLQSELVALQDKYQKGLITSANAQKQQASIESRAQAFQTSAQKQMADLDEENRVFTNRTQEMIRKAIENVNEGKRYKMIVNASALIDADTTLNISTVVLDEFNKLYKAEDNK